MTSLKFLYVHVSENIYDIIHDRDIVHRVSEKNPTHIIGYKLRNSCLILIIFDIKIPHII